MIVVNTAYLLVKWNKYKKRWGIWRVTEDNNQPFEVLPFEDVEKAIETCEKWSKSLRLKYKINRDQEN